MAIMEDVVKILTEHINKPLGKKRIKSIAVQISNVILMNKATEPTEQNKTDKVEVKTIESSGGKKAFVAEPEKPTTKRNVKGVVAYPIAANGDGNSDVGVFEVK